MTYYAACLSCGKVVKNITMVGGHPMCNACIKKEGRRHPRKAFLLAMCLILLCNPVFGGPKEGQCNALVSTCNALVKQLDLTIEHKNTQITLLERQLSEEKASFVPGWILFLGGALTGSIVMLYIKK